MELSQTALAMLFLVGFPAGTLLHVVYALTDTGVGNAHLGRLLMRQVKDFAFMIAAGLVAVLLSSLLAPDRNVCQKHAV